MCRSTPTRRRWFRFSLRTLFVGVTAIAVAGAFLMNSIHQRVQERKRIQEIGGRVNGVRESQQLWSNWRTHLYKYLGDAEIFSIFVPVSADQAEIDRIKKLFPEADIWTTEEISSGGIWTQPKVKRIWKVRDYIESGMTG